MKNIIKHEAIESKIIELREQKVLLDSDMPSYTVLKPKE